MNKKKECVFLSFHQIFFKVYLNFGGYYSRKDGISLYRKISATERYNAINKYIISKKNKSEHLLPGGILMSTLGNASFVSIIKGDHTKKE